MGRKLFRAFVVLGVIMGTMLGVRWNGEPTSAEAVTTKWDVLYAGTTGWFEIDVQGEVPVGLYLNPTGCPTGRSFYGYMDTNGDGRVDGYTQVGPWQPRAGVYTFSIQNAPHMIAGRSIMWTVCTGVSSTSKTFSPGTLAIGRHA
jgi:hypothetical protein